MSRRGRGEDPASPAPPPRVPEALGAEGDRGGPGAEDGSEEDLARRPGAYFLHTHPHAERGGAGRGGTPSLATGPPDPASRLA